MSDFVLTRVELDKDFTIGELSIGGHHIAWTVEDTVREIPGEPVETWKVHGQTAIPVGRYKIERTWSPRFQVTMPLLLDVPGFTGVRIHAGNTAADTDGCILPGLERTENGVRMSQLAYREILKWLDSIERQGLEAWITITNGGLLAPVPQPAILEAA